MDDSLFYAFNGILENDLYDRYNFLVLVKQNLLQIFYIIT